MQPKGHFTVMVAVKPKAGLHAVIISLLHIVPTNPALHGAGIRT